MRIFLSRWIARIYIVRSDVNEYQILFVVRVRRTNIVVDFGSVGICYLLTPWPHPWICTDNRIYFLSVVCKKNDYQLASNTYPNTIPIQHFCSLTGVRFLYTWRTNGSWRVSGNGIDAARRLLYIEHASKTCKTFTCFGYVLPHFFYTWINKNVNWDLLHISYSKYILWYNKLFTFLSCSYYSGSILLPGMFAVGFISLEAFTRW